MKKDCIISCMFNDCYLIGKFKAQRDNRIKLEPGFILKKTEYGPTFKRIFEITLDAVILPASALEIAIFEYLVKSVSPDDQDIKRRTITELHNLGYDVVLFNKAEGTLETFEK